jgi:hypothetical protein
MSEVSFARFSVEDAKDVAPLIYEAFRKVGGSFDSVYVYLFALLKGGRRSSSQA